MRKMMVWNVSLLLFIFVTLSGANVSAESETSPRTTVPYSLTISGGISLGVYEAGLNAIIVDVLKNKFTESQGKEFRLETVTGASAGAINTLISAITFCEEEQPDSGAKPVAYNNLFRDTWQHVDIEDLLSEDESDYNSLRLDMGEQQDRVLKDSLFARKVFANLVDSLRKRVNEGQFKDNMKLKMAFTVTRSRPVMSSLNTLGGGPQEIKTQRFAIPLTVTTRRVTENGDSKVRLFFQNDTSYHSQNGKQTEHLLLPESDGYVEFDQVVRAALASSAFPFAFGRVQLSYCQLADGADAATRSSAGTCPKGYNPSSGYFTDGGTFDNVPLGLAVDLVEPEGKEVPAFYIYLDHANRRAVPFQERDTVEDDGSLVLTEQVKSLVPAFGTLMEGELYRTLTAQFARDTNDHRYLLLTRRFPPLTGYYLGHFGAFLDPAFRLYDYSAGVYDGLMNATEYLYYLKPRKPTDPYDVAAVKAQIFLGLARRCLDFSNQTPEDAQLHQMIGTFLAWEKTSPAWNEAKELLPAFDKSTPAYAVFKAISKAGESDFNAFIKELEPYQDYFGEQVRYIVANPDSWGFLLGKSVIKRLIKIEEEGDGNLVTLLKVADIAVNSKKVSNNKTRWSLSSVSKKKPWYKLVPDGFAVDGIQTGLAFSYLAAPGMLVWDWAYLELDLSSIHAQIKEIKESRIGYWSSGVSLRHSFKNIAISSVGVGLYPNKNLWGRIDSDLLLGGEVNIGFLADKLRLSIGTRDLISNYSGEDWTARFGFTDIDAWLSLF